MFVDAHLDLAYNAFRGRDVLRPAAEQPADEGEIATVGLPDLHAGGVTLVCATIFTSPVSDRAVGYRTPEQAYEAGRKQLDWYLAREKEGHFAFARSKADLQRLVNVNEQSPASAHRPPLPAILLMENADPIRSPDDVQDWFDAGVRIVGLAWKRSRYAGGTGQPGPLTPDGVQLVRALDRVGMIHDVSHLAEESFWQLMNLTRGPVIASHSNCRAIVPTDRQLSDEMIRAIVSRGGVIGMNFFDKFLVPPAEASRRATLADVVTHIKHICAIAGNTHHVAIGTDMDGGLGRNEIPQEIVTAGDLPKVGATLAAAGFDAADVQRITATNWLEFFGKYL